jgi:1-acyl-sn-glycerol-3-phosphate acyltransferase
VNGTNCDGAASDLLAGTLHGRPRAILRAIALGVLRPMLSLRLIGVGKVPLDGPLLVASNHLSNADPIILEAVFPRPLFFLGKAELFRNPVFRWVLRRFGGIPLERGTADLSAIRRARAVLEQGIALGIYPEGVRSRTVALMKGLPGAGLIALQSGSPVLPVAIYGTEFFPVNGELPPRRPKALPRGVTVRFGSPIHIPERVDGKRVTADEATHLIMVRIAELLPERYHGVYEKGIKEETVLAERERS